MNLRIPGPTPIPPEALEALGQQMIGHRSPRFTECMKECLGLLQHFHQTQSDVLLLTGSGTAGLEAAVVNVLSPGDRVLAVSVGSFGDRFAAIARAFGGDVHELKYEWGQAFNHEDIKRALDERREPGAEFRVLLTTHNETSTGVLNDLAPVAALLDRMGDRRPLWLVDAVSSAGAVEIRMDELGIDMVISATQKAWMAPPGMSTIAVSERAWAAMTRAKCPRFYWDLQAMRPLARKGETLATPAVPVAMALRASLRRMAAEGLPAIVARHEHMGRQFREGVRALGLQILAADERYASPTVTAVVMPEGVSAKRLQARLSSAFGIEVATGQGKYADRLIRVAHMGYCSPADMDAVLDALREVFA